MSSKGPQWFRKLSKRTQDNIEQVLHAIMGFGAGALCLDLLIWRREWVTQWPPGKARKFNDRWYSPLDRVADTKRDLLFFTIGSTVAHVGRTVLCLWWLL